MAFRLRSAPVMEPHRSRIFLFALFIVLSFAALAYRLVNLQIVNGEKFFAVSEANSFRDIPVPAPRGKILDREGVVLAENRPVFLLTLNPAQMKDMEKSLATLAYLTDRDAEEIRERLATRKNVSPLLPWTVESDLGSEQVAVIRARMTRIRAGGEEGLDMSGIDLGLHFERRYPLKEKVGHVLGYVREIGQNDLKKWEEREPGRVRPGDDIGVAGVEKTFDVRLRGYDGFQQLLVDARGRETDLSSLGLSHNLPSVRAKPGEDLKLTLDTRLMTAAYEAMAGRVGAVVALDPRDGAILVWLSMPSYDPSDLSGEIPAARWAALRDHPDKILLNRPIQASYPPGSTHKILTALAAMASGKLDLKETINCPGYYQSGNRQWGCWNRKGHGRMNLLQALTHSCDVYFYKLGERLGPDPIARVAKLFGMGKKTGVLEDSEREGLIPTEDWKLAAKKEKWAPGDSLGTAIGQGYNLVTPLQNALMIAEVANGGKKISPHLLLEDESVPAPTGRLPLAVNEAQFESIRKALEAVVNAPGGTGAKARLEKIKVAGKTGTAQVVGHDSKGKVAKGVKTENHAWFVAYAPAENPEIALAVFVEHGGAGGGVAAPVAKQVLETYFKDKELTAAAAP